MRNLEQLMNEVSLITVSGLPIMEGKTKIEEKGLTLNHTLTVDDYGYLEGDNGEFVVITIKEYPKNFIYGSSVVTDAFKKIDEKLSKDEIKSLIENGLTFRLSEITSKNKRKYTKIAFFPKED